MAAKRPIIGPSAPQNPARAPLHVVRACMTCVLGLHSASVAALAEAPIKSLPGATRPQVPFVVKPGTPALNESHLLVRVKSGHVGAAAASQKLLPGVQRLRPLAPAVVASATTANASRSAWFVADLQGGISVEQAIGELRAHEDIVDVEPDYRVGIPAPVQAAGSPSVRPAGANDPYASQQYALNRIQAAAAWAANAGRRDVVVAVIDTGVQLNHPDLASAIWRNPAEQLNGKDDDGNGYVDDICGVDLIDHDNDPSDGLGHGTHVAGIIAAVRNNGTGIAGAANVSILPIRVLDSQGIGDTSAIMIGIDYAVRMGAQVINLSLGGGPYSSAFDEICRRAYASNVVILSSSGNDGATSVAYPGAYSSVIAVGATDAQDQLAYFSNTGPGIELVAPGVGILSTWASSSYEYGDGTSMACPYAAGVAALIRSAHPELDVAAVRATLDGTADDLGNAGYDTAFGYGRINAYRALTETPSAVEPPDTTEDSGTVSNDDAFEPNNDAAHAAFIERGTYDLEGNDDDWLTFTLTASCEVNVSINGVQGDLDLYLFDGAGREIAGSYDSGSRETILTQLPAGRYLIAISPYMGNGGSYRLQLAGRFIQPFPSGPSNSPGLPESPQSPGGSSPDITPPDTVFVPACGAGAAQAMIVTLALLLTLTRTHRVPANPLQAGTITLTPDIMTSSGATLRGHRPASYPERDRNAHHHQYVVAGRAQGPQQRQHLEPVLFPLSADAGFIWQTPGTERNRCPGRRPGNADGVCECVP